MVWEMAICQYAARLRIWEMLEAVSRIEISPHLLLSVAQMHQHGNVLAVDNRDGCSNGLQHSHAKEAVDLLHNCMMHLACSVGQR